MTHVRQQIRNAVTTAITGLSITGNNVFESHVYTLGSDQLPALVVNTSSETQELLSKTNSTTKLKRVLELAITALVKTKTNYDETIDRIMVEIEESIQTNSNLQNLVKFIYPKELNIDFTGEGDIPVSIATQMFQVEYHTSINDVESVN